MQKTKPLTKDGGNVNDANLFQSSQYCYFFSDAILQMNLILLQPPPPNNTEWSHEIHRLTLQLYPQSSTQLVFGEVIGEAGEVS